MTGTLNYFKILRKVLFHVFEIFKTVTDKMLSYRSLLGHDFISLIYKKTYILELKQKFANSAKSSFFSVSDQSSFEKSLSVVCRLFIMAGVLFQSFTTDCENICLINALKFSSGKDMFVPQHLFYSNFKQFFNSKF